VGLLGIITGITVQLQHIGSGRVIVRRRSAGSLDEIFTILAEEQPASDFLEAWLDGFAGGQRLGRGYVTSATVSAGSELVLAPPATGGTSDRLKGSLVHTMASLARPVLIPGVRLANLASFWWTNWDRTGATRHPTLLAYTYWPPAAFAGYHALFPEGVETLQAFVPAAPAAEVFGYILRTSQQQRHIPLWCVMKMHRRDHFLLSYQVEGFSLELNYRRTGHTSAALERMLRQIIAVVIEAGGRFYLAKDHFLTAAQYRQSVGDAVVDSFLQLKRQYDPEMLLQSDQFRRVFQPTSG
jgi:decaprenylphospho-beta-D-ribofuranose 2-oxidase